MSGLVIAGHRVPGWAPVAAAGLVGVALALRARSAAAATDPLAGAGITAADLAGGVGPPLPGFGADTTGGAPGSPVGNPPDTTGSTDHTTLPSWARGIPGAHWIAVPLGAVGVGQAARFGWMIVGADGRILRDPHAPNTGPTLGAGTVAPGTYSVNV